MSVSLPIQRAWQRDTVTYHPRVMIQKVVIMIGLNEEGESLEFGHEVAH
jgi:hypothetical protein